MWNVYIYTHTPYICICIIFLKCIISLYIVYCCNTYVTFYVTLYIFKLNNLNKEIYLIMKQFTKLFQQKMWAD